jgi:hypothetical protein
MVAKPGESYVRYMLTKTIRLAHPELCDGCADLLPTGTAVLVDGSLHVSCARCAGDVRGRRAADPWAWVDDPELRHRLQHRHDADARQLISA